MIAAFRFALICALTLGSVNATPLQAQEVRGTTGETIRLNVGEAKFIRLPAAAKAVFLSDPATAEIDLQSARNLYIVGQRIGVTTLFVLGEDDEEMLSTRLNVTVDTAKLTRAANRAVSGGSVRVNAEDGAVFLSGKVRNADDAATVQDVVAGLLTPETMVVSRLTMQTLAQVNLQVRIAEVSRSISEDLGISLTASSSSGGRGIAAPASDIGGFSVGVSSGSRNINLVLDALARNGLVTILSEPNLTARSGEAATFLAGGRVPYATVDGEGRETYTLEPIGVELEFTPTVRDGNQIEIALTTRVRDVDQSTGTGTDNPALTERSATTTVELGSGQSFAIAGMFRASSNQSLSGLPGIAKLPIIGALFRSSRFARGETEMVIIVTPYLVRPGAPGQFETPLDRIDPARSGLEQAVTGQMTRNPLRPGAGEGKSAVRSGGFLLE